ncbi:hypothetical protein BDK51DRAFT_47829 [Blyttiomyces helicus]|uniref:SMP-LTD domain-containing protein n=1 Tax=Blyttiomyces helicus TaxID=388810 RepID=A0A4P9W4I8_9FUNG|nr:hypothetical protein BDK51DRAFT_47829 [Blyttiomyces helicus]|eukprot:RKO85610.1 hypothetical protein BDK51DRAFT_47829 [Blyttiomyces helicus]
MFGREELVAAGQAASSVGGSARRRSSGDGGLVLEVRGGGAAAMGGISPSRHGMQPPTFAPAFGTYAGPFAPYPPSPASTSRAGGWGNSGVGLGLGLSLRPSQRVNSSAPSTSSSPPPSTVLSDAGRSPAEVAALHEEAMLRFFLSERPDMSEADLALRYADARRKETDAQVEITIAYKGNMRLAVSTELIVNQPTPAFMVLPLTLTLTGFAFRATAIIAYLSDRINFCFKEPTAGESPQSHPLRFESILHDVSIDSEVGDRNRQGMQSDARVL